MRPTRITVTATSSPTNSGVSVRNVPAVGGHDLLAAERAADGEHRDHRAGTGPTSMTMPSVVLNHWVFALSPANAEPLLLAADV